jgi:hypothetical protein
VGWVGEQLQILLNFLKKPVIFAKKAALKEIDWQTIGKPGAVSNQLL